MTYHHGLAFDRASVRTKDVDGRLHVAVSHISMEQVADYLGREIVGWQALELNPDRLYKVYRPADEIAKAAPTFNNIPILSQHVPVSAANHRPDLVVGSTGSDAVFKAPYLDNSLVVWAADAIEGIESDEQKELSAAYRYTPVVERGTFKGQPYDIRMVDLIANHVALVAAGRAGPTVVVGDSLPKELETMKRLAPSRMAVLVRGALLALAPTMAADAKLDIPKITSGVTPKNWAERKPIILAAIQPHLAADADVQSLVKLLDGLDADAMAPNDNLGVDDPAGMPPADPLADPIAAPAADPAAPGLPGADPAAAPPGLSGTEVDDKLNATDADPCAELMGMLQGKLSPEDLAAFEAKLRAAIAPPATDGDPAAAPPNGGPPSTPNTPAPPTTTEDPMTTKTAMDAAIAAATKQAVADGRKLAKEIAEAERFVRPWVGEIVAQDSAEDTYKAALGLIGIKTDGIHPSAFRAILEAQPKQGAETRPMVAVAMDASSSLAKSFPYLARITVAG